MDEHKSKFDTGDQNLEKVVHQPAGRSHDFYRWELLVPTDSAKLLMQFFERLDRRGITYKITRVSKCFSLHSYYRVKDVINKNILKMILSILFTDALSPLL